MFWIFESVILFASVLAHELGHCYGAFMIGGHVDSILLWPLGGLALVSGAEKNPETELKVTALGPAVSVALALAAWFALFVINTFFPVRSSSLVWTVAQIIRYTAWLNTLLALFNLLFPLFPMDSARLLRAFLSFRNNPGRVTYHLCTFGIYFGIGIAILTFLSRFTGIIKIPFAGTMLILIGVFGAIASYNERLRIENEPVYEDFAYRGGLLFDIPSSNPFQSIRSSVTERYKKWRRRPRRGSIQDLKHRMDDALLREDYKEAARLRDLIERKKRA